MFCGAESLRGTTHSVQKFLSTRAAVGAEILPVFFPLGGGVQHYECRIITPSGAVTLISYGSFISDFGATRAAKSLCRDGELAEVWRGDLCVYSESPKTKVALVWPIQIKRADHAARSPGQAP
jgi:hypothetical protein